MNYIPREKNGTMNDKTIIEVNGIKLEVDMRYACEKHLAKAVAEIMRLRAVLEQCAAPFISEPCTVNQGHILIAKEFIRRIELANRALATAEARNPWAQRVQ